MSRVAALWPAHRLGRRASSSVAGEPPSVTFPATRLVSRVQLALAYDPNRPWNEWNWLDITSYVRQDLGISLTVGRRDEASQVTTGSATLKLDNRDGRFTRRNPNSPYYGLLSKNTPIWVTVDAGSGEKTRLEMFVNEWPTRWSDLSATDSTVTIRCAGILRRLGQGEVLKTVLRRFIQANNPYSYWSLDDGPLSVAGVLTSGVGGPFTATLWGGGGVNPGSAEVAPWLGAGLQLAGTAQAVEAEARLPVLAPASRVVLDATVKINLGSTNSQVTSIAVIDRHTDATTPASVCQVWAIQLDFGSGTISPVLVAAFGGGIVFSNGSTVSFDADPPHHLRMDLTQNGANIDAVAYLDGVVVGSGTLAGNTLTAFRFAFVRLLHNASVGPDTGANVVYTDVALWVDAAPPPVATTVWATQGFAGEQAAVRIERLCREEGVPFSP